MPAKHNPGDIAARRKWDAANMSTCTVKARKDLIEQFKAICKANGETPNSVLKKAIEDYISFNTGMG